MPAALLRTPNPQRIVRATQEAVREELQAEGKRTRDDWRGGVRKQNRNLEQSIKYRTKPTPRGVELDVFSKKRVGRKGWFHADLDNKGWQHTGHNGEKVYAESSRGTSSRLGNPRPTGLPGTPYPHIPGTEARDKAERGLRSRLRGRKARIAARVAQKVNRRG